MREVVSGQWIVTSGAGAGQLMANYSNFSPATVPGVGLGSHCVLKISRKFTQKSLENLLSGQWLVDSGVLRFFRLQSLASFLLQKNTERTEKYRK